MFMRVVHVSDILLRTVAMNDTYVIENDEEDSLNASRHATIDYCNNNNNGKHKKGGKGKTKHCNCKTKLFVTLSCCFTLIIIAAFSYLFGPLILEDAFKSHKFTALAVKVQHYRLRLMTNDSSNDDMFTGRASILFNNGRRMRELRVQSCGLNYTSVRVTQRKYSADVTGTRYHIGNATSVDVTSIRHVSQRSRLDNSYADEYIINLGRNLQEGADYMLDIQFMGYLNGSGFIRRSVFNAAQNGKSSISQQIIFLKESCGGFPLFGQGSMQFEVSVARPTYAKCLSNVPLKETEIMRSHDGYVWDHFKTTPPIFPESLGLVIADFKALSVHNPAKSNVLLNVYTMKEKHIASLAYAAKIIPEIFGYFQRYFNEKYPFAKLDLVLIDNETMASKPSLITLSSDQLLLDISDDNIANRREIFKVVSQAIALQWIGHKIDPIDDVAIGLAAYLTLEAEIALNNQEKWMSEEFFVMDRFKRDDPGTKVAYILKMIRGLLTEEEFQVGINSLINDRTANFWDSLRVATLGNFTGKQFLFKWLHQRSYPIISVTRTTGWNVLITQHPMSSRHDDEVYLVPLSYTSSASNLSSTLILSESHMEKNLFVPQTDWILFNNDQNGFYRMNYDVDNWRLLIAQLHDQPAAISSMNRARLINDAFALADRAMLSHKVAFDLLGNYLRAAGAKERNYFPWKAAMDALNNHLPIYLDSALYGLFRKFKIELLRPLWTKRHSLDENLSNLVATELCDLQFPFCTDNALELYEKFRYRKDVVIPQSVYCTAVAHLDEEEFDYLFAKMQSTENLRLMHILLEALTCTKVSWKTTSLLDFSLSVHPNQAKRIWRAMSSSSLGRLTGLAFIEAHWPGNNATGRIFNEDLQRIVIDEFITKLSTQSDLNKVQALYLECSPTLTKHFEKALAAILQRIEWSNKYFYSFSQEMTDALKIFPRD